MSVPADCEQAPGRCAARGSTGAQACEHKWQAVQLGRLLFRMACCGMSDMPESEPLRHASPEGHRAPRTPLGQMEARTEPCMPREALVAGQILAEFRGLKKPVEL